MSETIYQKNLDSWVSRFPESTKAKLASLLEKDREARDAGKVIFPERNNILRSLELTGYEDTRCVILGQDPFHSPHQAMGLAFSVPEGVKIPPSLRNIFKEYHSDLGYNIPKSGDLSKWAGEGVLLLNTVLTVEEGKANSHKDIGWQDITSEVLKLILQREKPVVFLLWGKQAIETAEAVKEYDKTRSAVWLQSTHPSPLSATRQSDNGKLKAFIGSKPFSKTNEWLRILEQDEIDWRLE